MENVREEIDEQAEVEPVVIDERGQVAMFPAEEKARKLQEEVDAAFRRIRRLIKPIGEHGEFFKLLSKYAAQLDAYPNDAADELLGENLKFALSRCNELHEMLSGAAESLREARCKQAELRELDVDERKVAASEFDPTVEGAFLGLHGVIHEAEAEIELPEPDGQTGGILDNDLDFDDDLERGLI